MIFSASISFLKPRTTNNQLKCCFSLCSSVLLPLPSLQWYDLNASFCILCLSAGRPQRGGLPEDGMCQPRSGHQELLQGAVDLKKTTTKKNASKVLKFAERRDENSQKQPAALPFLNAPQNLPTVLFLPTDKLRLLTIVYFALL